MRNIASGMLLSSFYDFKTQMTVYLYSHFKLNHSLPMVKFGRLTILTEINYLAIPCSIPKTLPANLLSYNNYTRET